MGQFHSPQASHNPSWFPALDLMFVNWSLHICKGGGAHGPAYNGLVLSFGILEELAVAHTSSTSKIKDISIRGSGFRHAWAGPARSYRECEVLNLGSLFSNNPAWL
jgi:hypothetical protein